MGADVADMACGEPARSILLSASTLLFLEDRASSPSAPFADPVTAETGIGWRTKEAFSGYDLAEVNVVLVRLLSEVGGRACREDAGARGVIGFGARLGLVTDVGAGECDGPAIVGVGVRVVAAEVDDPGAVAGEVGPAPAEGGG